jgi:putative phosphoserine phosphatase/1-acylglycerol-3-phosphate O-acyltransferase
MTLHQNVVDEVEQSADGSQVGAFFDFDGTIIYGYSATGFLREQIRLGYLTPTQLLELTTQ